MTSQLGTGKSLTLQCRSITVKITHFFTLSLESDPKSYNSKNQQLISPRILYFAYCKFITIRRVCCEVSNRCWLTTSPES